MVAAILNAAKTIRSALTPTWLTGPIFDKELRVSSRRRRTYVLRFLYVALLTIYTALCWIAIVRESGYSNAYGSAQMSQAGKIIVATLVWFQFIAVQLLAVIMLSTSISDEIYHRTLAVLMTTPITGLQIVLGKLFSKLLQLALLLAIGLPILAIIRVLGGVPTEFVVASFCLTATAMLFAASVSLLLSIFNRRAYMVIILSLVVLGILYALIPFLTIMILQDTLRGNLGAMNTIGKVICAANPFGTLMFHTQRLMSPGRSPFSASWPLNCLVMAGASAVVLAMAIRNVRKVAMRQANSEAGILRSRREARRAAAATRPAPSVAAGQANAVLADRFVEGRIRRVRGWPMVWKELRAPLFRRRLSAILAASAVVIIVLVTYAACWRELLRDPEAHFVYVAIFWGLGTLYTAVLAATPITAEKESRSWPILLASPISDWQILFGKAVGVFRKCLPAWLPLAGHVLLFTILGKIHPIALLLLGMIAVWVTLLLTGSGLCFSARFKRTTTAVVMNIGLVLTLWAIVPGLTGLAMLAADVHSDDAIEAVATVNPAVQTIVVMTGTVHVQSQWRGAPTLHFEWPHGHEPLAETFLFIFLSGLAYCLLGFVLAWGGLRAFRRHIF